MSQLDQMQNPYQGEALDVDIRFNLPERMKRDFQVRALLAGTNVSEILRGWIVGYLQDTNTDK